MSFYAVMLRIVRQRTILITVILIMALAIAAADALFLPRYKSEATILISADQYLSQLGSDTVDQQSTERFLDAQRISLKSDYVLLAALDNVYPDEDHGENNIIALRSDVLVKRAPFTNAVELELTRHVPEDMRSLLSAIIDSYSVRLLSEIYKDATQLKRSLEAEAGELEAELMEAEKELDAFDEQNKTAFITELYLSAKNEADRIAAMLAKAENRLEQLRPEDDVWKSPNRPLAGLDIRSILEGIHIALGNVFTDNNNSDYVSECGGSRNGMNDERINCADIEICRESHDLSAQINRWMNNHAKRLEYEAKIEELAKQEDRLAGDLFRLIQLKAQRRALEKSVEFASWESLIASARVRNIGRIIDNENAVSVERVMSPSSPVFINSIWRNLLYGFWAGLCVSFFVVYVLALHSSWPEQKRHHEPGSVRRHRWSSPR